MRWGWVLAAFAAVGLLTFAGIRCGYSSPTITWQLASEGAPPGLMQQVQTDALQPNAWVDVGQMYIWRIQQPNQAQPLYLIDSRTGQASESPLCGALGCAFFGYISTESGFQQVYAAYLDPHLPPDTELFEPLESQANGLPQLRLYQLEHPQLHAFTLTFDGHRYTVADVNYRPLPHE